MIVDKSVIIGRFSGEREPPLVLPTTSKSCVPNITYGLMKKYDMGADWKHLRYLASDWELGTDLKTGEPIIFPKFKIMWGTYAPLLRNNDSTSSIIKRLFERMNSTDEYGLSIKLGPALNSDDVYYVCIDLDIKKMLNSVGETVEIPSEKREILLEDMKNIIVGLYGDTLITGSAGNGVHIIYKTNTPSIFQSYAVVKALKGYKYTKQDPNGFIPIGIDWVTSNDWNNMRHTTVQGLRKDGNGYFGIISDNPVAYVEDLIIERLNKDLTRIGVIEYDKHLEKVLSDELKLKQFLTRQKSGRLIEEDVEPWDVEMVGDEVNRSLLDELPGCLKDMVLTTVQGGRNTTLLIVRSLVKRMLDESEYVRNGQGVLLEYNKLFREPLDETEVKQVFNGKDYNYRHSTYKPYCQKCGDYYLKTGEFEVYIHRTPYRGETRALVYPSRFEDKKLTPVMKYTKQDENGNKKHRYEPIANGLELIDSNVYLPIYEDIEGIQSTYDITLNVRGEQIKYNKITGKNVRKKLTDNHAIVFNHDQGSGDNFIDIVHTLAKNRGQVGWTAGGKGIYYRDTQQKIVAEDFKNPNLEGLKIALKELDKLVNAMYLDTRDEMIGIILWFLAAPFNLVRKQLGYGAALRHPSMVNAGDINRGKSEAAEIALRMYLEYDEIIRSERSSSSFSTKARRRESLGDSSIPIRIEEFDGKNVDEFEEDIRDIFNNPYFQIQKTDGSTRQTMIKSVPYISTNDKMIFQKPAFAKRCIVYESNGSIPQEAMKHYSDIKGEIDFSQWTEIGNIAVDLVLNKTVTLEQPWDVFAIDLITNIYKKVDMECPAYWKIPDNFKPEIAMRMIDDNVQEKLTETMRRAIINKLISEKYDPNTIHEEIEELAEKQKTRWMFKVDKVSGEYPTAPTILIKPRIFEEAGEDHKSIIPRGHTRKVLTQHGGKYYDSGVKVHGASRSSGIVIEISKLVQLLFD